MLDDHEDAAKWAVEQGFADADRICISGGSYGGYATLMALARFPKTFRCGISGLMVSDWKLMADFAGRGHRVQQSGRRLLQRFSSEQRIRPGIPSDVSPVNLADRIKQPVLVYAGADDIRTPLEQTNAMVRALERAGNPPKKVIVKAGEGHGFGKLENNVELYNEIIDFLDATIGAKSKR